jgi:hypothetical protein
MVTVTGVTALVPPAPEAERLTTASPVFVGVPVIAPVVALRVAHVGSELAAHDVAGKFSVSVIEGVTLNAAPTLPVMVCPGTMIGVPAAIASEAVAVPTPPVPVAVRVTVVVALSCGVPVISPVKALIDSPAGRPVADQLLTGRFAASVSAGVALNESPKNTGNF